MKYPKEIIEICQRLREHGNKAWLVGGSVRDSLMGREPKDWDLATNALPNEVIEIFDKVIPTGIKHGTVTVMMNGEGYEVTTLRGDGKYTDGRRPESVVYVQSIVEDLSRRDFTCNAIAFDPISNQMVDPFGGVNDISLGILKAVGNPLDRFMEDGLRILRAARFAATLGFYISGETEFAMAHSAALETFSKVAIERVREEWMKAMKAEAPSVAFEIMLKAGMLDLVCPELVALVDCEQNDYHEYDVWRHTMVCLNKAPPENPLLRMAALFHDIAKPAVREWSEKKSNWTFIGHEKIGEDMTKEIMTRMKFSNAEIDYVSHLVRRHLIMYSPRWSKATIRRWIKKVGQENIEDVLELATADSKSKGSAKISLQYTDEKGLNHLRERVEKVLEEKPPILVRDLAINGHEIMSELGLTPGPAVGNILKALMTLTEERPELNEKTILLEKAKEIHEG